MKGCLQAQFNAAKTLCPGFHMSPVVLFLVDLVDLRGIEMVGHKCVTGNW